MKWHLVVEQGCRKGVVVSINAEVYRIGRGSSCQLRPASTAVGWVHCILKHWDGRLFVESGSASTQTFVNDQLIHAVTELYVGDRLAVGPLAFRIGAKVDARREVKPGGFSQEESFGNLLLSLDESSTKNTSMSDTANHVALSSQDTATQHPASGSEAKRADQEPAVGNTSNAANEILHQYLRRSR